MEITSIEELEVITYEKYTEVTSLCIIDECIEDEELYSKIFKFINLEYFNVNTSFDFDVHYDNRLAVFQKLRQKPLTRSEVCPVSLYALYFTLIYDNCLSFSHSHFRKDDNKIVQIIEDNKDIIKSIIVFYEDSDVDRYFNDLPPQLEYLQIVLSYQISSLILTNLPFTLRQLNIVYKHYKNPDIEAIFFIKLSHGCDLQYIHRIR
ncbi:MAG: hypothetical protein Gaeavirus15_1 [Gaeavirus sp.]|uniref:Uncharacterized protein n=1 Tax=Gaeavirus sp. TaxID=2487767 RepID=A0A3G5A1X4_9VIRU|nr:MAG: hypothetical protein Gaeavirus15_1 [Gaeavirus sp.]